MRTVVPKVHPALRHQAAAAMRTRPGAACSGLPFELDSGVSDPPIALSKDQQMQQAAA
jgi:hypothetical protein